VDVIFRKIISFVTLLAFLLNGNASPVFSQSLSQPHIIVNLSPAFQAPVLKGVKVYRDDPFRLDFIMDKGDLAESMEQGAWSKKQKDNTNNSRRSMPLAPSSLLRAQSIRLIKYFLAALTVPGQDLWVNLSPYEKDRIIPEAFGRTEMGRELLSQDYILKNTTASLLSPESPAGQKFWDKIYAEAQKRYGTTDIPVDTFNKVWIVPEKAIVYENKDAAFVVESRLKVLLENDYLAESKEHGAKSKKQNRINANLKESLDDSPHFSVLSAPGSMLARQILKDIVLPVLEREVNEGVNFAPLRQAYHSLILAAWYKKKVMKSLLSRVYVEKNKVRGVEGAGSSPGEIWGQYVEAFKKGAHNFIREEYDPVLNESVPRKYFSGGMSFDGVRLDAVLSFAPALPDGAMSGRTNARLTVLEARLAPAGVQPAVAGEDFYAAPGRDMERDYAMAVPRRPVTRAISLEKKLWKAAREAARFLRNFRGVPRVFSYPGGRISVEYGGMSFNGFHLHLMSTDAYFDEDVYIQYVDVAGLMDIAARQRDRVNWEDAHIYLLERPLSWSDIMRLHESARTEIDTMELGNGQMLVSFGNERLVNMPVMESWRALAGSQSMTITSHSHLPTAFFGEQGTENIRDVWLVPSPGDQVHTQQEFVHNSYGVCFYKVHPLLFNQARAFRGLVRGLVPKEDEMLTNDAADRWKAYVGNGIFREIRLREAAGGKLTNAEIIKVYEEHGIFLEVRLREDIHTESMADLAGEMRAKVEERIRQADFQAIRDRLVSEQRDQDKKARVQEWLDRGQALFKGLGESLGADYAMAQAERFIMNFDGVPRTFSYTGGQYVISVGPATASGVEVNLEDTGNGFKQSARVSFVSLSELQEKAKTSRGAGRKDLNNGKVYLLERSLTWPQRRELAVRANTEVRLFGMKNGQMLVAFGQWREVDMPVMALWRMLAGEESLPFAAHNHLPTIHTFMKDGKRDILDYQLVPSTPDQMVSRGEFIFNDFGVIFFKAHPRLLNSARALRGLVSGRVVGHEEMFSKRGVKRWAEYVGDVIQSVIYTRREAGKLLTNEEIIKIYEEHGVFIEVRFWKDVLQSGMGRLEQEMREAVNTRIVRADYQAIRGNLLDHVHYVDGKVQRSLVRQIRQLEEIRSKLLVLRRATDDTDYFLAVYRQRLEDLADWESVRWREDRRDRVESWLERGEKLYQETGDLLSGDSAMGTGVSSGVQRWQAVARRIDRAQSEPERFLKGMEGMPDMFSYPGGQYMVTAEPPRPGAVWVHLQTSETNVQETAIIQHVNFDQLKQYAERREGLQRSLSGWVYLLKQPLSWSQKKELIRSSKVEVRTMGLKNGQMLVSLGQKEEISMPVMDFWLQLAGTAWVPLRTHNHPISGWRGFKKGSDNIFDYFLVPSGNDQLLSQGDVVFNHFGLSYYKVHPRLMNMARATRGLVAGKVSRREEMQLFFAEEKWEKYVFDLIINAIDRKKAEAGGLRDEDVVRIFEEHGVFIDFRHDRDMPEDVGPLVEDMKEAVEERIRRSDFQAVQGRLLDPEYYIDAREDARVRAEIQQLEERKIRLSGQVWTLSQVEERIKALKEGRDLWDRWKSADWRQQRRKEVAAWLARSEALYGSLGEPLGADYAMAERAPGGIDLTAERLALDVKASGEGVMDFDPALLEQYAGVAGFTPVVVAVRPLGNVGEFFN
jgi:hypothetical protein